MTRFVSRLVCCLVVLLAFAPGTHAAADARPPEPMDAGRLAVALQRLQNSATVLYVGAHPDDENTAFLCWLTRGRFARVAYLSLTRGDGGQNLIGTEQGNALGALRTQELLAARRIDGAEQCFTRAVDFGFSKNPDEALAIWDRDSVLSDVVRVIREFRPDVIVTRFGTDGSGGHGHHTASAILAGEAFRAAADPARFPESARAYGVWQAKRLVWNNWQPKPAAADSGAPALLSVDIGGYQPLLGRSFTEIAALSRSMHKSQGFGSAERRGPSVQYLQHIDGAAAVSDLFDGIDASWKRIAGGERVGALLSAAAKAFDPRDPAASVPLLMRAEAAARSLPQEPWIASRRAELREVIRGCAGLWLEAIAGKASVTPGASLPVHVSVMQRAGANVKLHGISVAGAQALLSTGSGADSGRVANGLAMALPINRAIGAEATVTIPLDAPITQPYWLREPARGGMFTVADSRLIGTPENAPAVSARVVLGLGADSLVFDVPVVTRSTDPVEGERYRPLEIAPPVTFSLDRVAYLFADKTPREVRIIISRADTTVAGRVTIEAPAGWIVSPAAQDAPFERGSLRAEMTVRVTPPSSPGSGVLAVSFVSHGRTWSHRAQRIDHAHVPVLTLFPPAEARLTRADVVSAGLPIGYLMGSGDAVADALTQLGARVTQLSDDDVESGDLSRYPVIVVGVRAYNTRPRLLAAESRLRSYVTAGGRLVVQYQTPDAAMDGRLGPYPFTVSRDRVSVETAEMRMPNPDHVLLQKPNAIGTQDFDGWVQERGLSFAQPFDPRYETPFSANDPGEAPKSGSLLYARSGRGTYTYVGLALFRQLPAGVPGAYRLLANLVSSSPVP